MSSTVQLEPAAQAFAEATSRSPFLFELEPARGRQVVDEVQSSAIDLDGTNMAISGDSVGGNMTAALTLTTDPAQRAEITASPNTLRAALRR